MGQDANAFRSKLTALNPVSRVSVDQARSGNTGRDGYAVLDQARPKGHDDPWSLTGDGRNRKGLTQRVYDGPNLDYTE